MSRSFIIVTAIVLGVLAVYGQAGRFGFICYDDPTYVIDNPHVTTGLTLQNIAWSLTATRASNWHPLTWMSHMADCSLFGLEPGGPHLVNVLIHLISSLLIYWILLRMTGAAWPSGLAALLFAVHPLHVESVAWVSERKDVLSVCLGLLAISAYISYARSRHWAWYMAAVVLFGLSLMAKPMLVTLPLILLLLDYWPLRRIGGGGGRGVLWVVLEKLPLLALSAADCIVTMISQRNGGAMGLSPPLFERLGHAMLTSLVYLGKLFVPINLGVGYPHPAALGMPISLVAAIAALVVLIVLTIATLALRRRAPYLIVGWLWFLVTLVPVIGIVQVGVQGMADRYMYLPSIGIFIALAWSAWELLSRAGKRQTVFWGAAASALVACILLAHRQAGYWRDSIALFEHSTQVIPDNYIGHDCLGIAYGVAKRPRDAIAQFGRSLKLYPNNPETRCNLGVELYTIGQYRQAIAQYAIALRENPKYADAHNNLANALDAIGRSREAAEHYQIALRLKPDLTKAHYNFAMLLAAHGRLDDAINHFQEALKLDPNYANAHHYLAWTLDRACRAREAIEQERQALDLKPDWPDALSHLSWMLATDADARVRRPDEAMDLAARACELTAYQQIDPLESLAAACAASGRFPEAVRLAERARDIARQGGQSARAETIARRVALFRQGRAYVSPTSAATRPARPTTATAEIP
jgi:tetratricopeptide (TPR) repeat protein